MVALVVGDIERLAFDVTANSTSAVTVAYPGVTSKSLIYFSLKTAAGTPAAQPYVATRTPGTGFTFKAGSGDTSVYNCYVL